MAEGVGLVLEGGGMRVTYTGGVLDAFLDHHIDFGYVIGVSAGANAGADYVAGQRERNHRVFVDFASDPRYASWRNVVRERSWFGMRFLFETLPDRLAPFDYEAFAESGTSMVVGVTDCVTGQPVYFCQHDHDPRWFTRTVMRASSSLPLVSPPVCVNGRHCYDGGLADSIPLARAIADGSSRNVLVLTQNAGYRKPAQRSNPIASVMLRRYPAVRRTLRDRPARYNACLDEIDARERDGSVFALRPGKPLAVGRMDRDPARLEALYRQGYDETAARVAELREWLEVGARAPS
jgi:predicted patatin/cPLA2 family phospholipase